jgi:squalene-hopene/tetraprenyl-beta-curcumene cyclase
MTFSASVARAADRPQTDTEKKAIDFLLTKQDPTGAWLPRVGPGLTALTTQALLQSGKTIDDPAVKKALNYIASTHQSDGGYYTQGQATYNTAIVLNLLAKLPHDQYATQIQQAQTFLKNIQEGADANAKDDAGKPLTKDHPWFGGWGYGVSGAGGGGGGGRGGSRPDLSNTQFVIEALRDSGIPATDPTIQNALVFVTRMQASEQNDLPWSKGQTDGGFIYSMGFNKKHNFYGTSAAPDHADRDGNEVLTTYGSITYAGLKSLLYANLTQDDPRVKAVLTWVSNHWTLDINPGMGDASGLYYYYHTLASALAASHEETLTDAKGVKHDWREEYQAHMKTLQRADGSFANTVKDRWMEQAPELATTYVVLGLQSIRLHPQP